ncbi:MAG: alanine racemase [bacterium]|nr:alanine racemase [bacterium]
MSLNWIEISKDALIHNVNLIKEKAKGKRILAVIKSNAYGHGLIQVAQIIKDHVDAFIVGDFEEAMELYDYLKDAKIIISLPSLSEKELFETSKLDFHIFVGNLQYLNWLHSIKLAQPIKVHLEINTGMNRSGLSPEELLKALEIIYNSKSLRLKGLFSHYATLPENTKFAKIQAEKFKSIVEKIPQRENLLIHMENTSGILKLLLDFTNSVRPGISLYGLVSSETKNYNFKPVLSLYSTIIDILKIKKGEGVSYDHLFKAKRDMFVATIPFGYGNGYMWNLKGKAEIIVKGKRVPVIGKICMNHIIFDASEVIDYIKIGDKVTLIGQDGQEQITVEELAKKSGTINYEIVTKLSSKIKRIIV